MQRCPLFLIGVEEEELFTSHMYFALPEHIHETKGAKEEQGEGRGVVVRG